MDTLAAPEKADPAGDLNRTIILIIVLMGVAMGVLDGIMVSIALPTITSYFNAGVTLSQWIVTAYLVTETSLLLIFGRIADYTGKNRLFLAGFIIFTASSLACGLAASLPELILYRILQAAGAAMVFSISSAILFEAFPKREQGRAMGYIGATIAAASIASPMLGGFITDAFGWEYIFLINVPIGVILLILAFRYLKWEKTPVRGGLSMDWAGAGTMVLALVAFILLLGELATDLTLSGTAILYGGVALLSSAAFFVIESRHPHPILDLSVMRIRKFVFPSSAMFLLYAAFFMMNLIGPFYLEIVMDLTPVQVGMVFLIAPVILVVASPITGWLYDRYESRYLATLGIFLSGISLVFMSAAAFSRSLTFIILSFIPLAIGGALFTSPNNTEIMQSLPEEKSGVASSLSATIRDLAMTLGVSLSSILLAYQLHASGYFGPVVSAAPELFSSAVGIIIIIAAAFCFIGTGFSLLDAVKRET